MTPASQRIAYLDVIKAMAIFYIVEGHVVYFGFRQEIVSYLLDYPPPALGLFFFIAGLMAGRTRTGERPVAQQLWARLTRLVVPAVMICLICAAIGHQHPMLSFFQAYEQRWFCFVLFLISAIFIVLKPLYRKIGTIWRIALLGVAYLLIALFFYFFDQYQFFVFWNAIYAYPPIFFLGILLADKRQRVEELCRRQSIITAAIILFVIIATFRFGDRTSRMLLISVAAIAPAFAIGMHLTEKLPARVITAVQYLGRRSLPVYLLHYLFIFPLTFFTPYLMQMSVAPVALALITIPCAALLIGLSLAIDYLLGLSPVLSRIFVGGKN